MTEGRAFGELRAAAVAEMQPSDLGPEVAGSDSQGQHSRESGQTPETALAPLPDPAAIPAHDAITQVAEHVSGNGSDPSQPVLFDLTKPFNFEGVMAAIAEKNRDVRAAKARYEDSKDETAHRRKVWERLSDQLTAMINDADERLTQRERQIADAVEAAQEPAGTTNDTEAGQTSAEGEIAQPEPSVSAEKANAEGCPSSVAA